MLKRKLLSVLLALVLVVSMAVPTFAATQTWRGTYANNGYALTVTRYSTSANATMAYDATREVMVYGAATVYVTTYDDSGYSRPQTSTETSTATIYMDNEGYLTDHGKYFTGVITAAFAYGYVQGTEVQWGYL